MLCLSPVRDAVSLPSGTKNPDLHLQIGIIQSWKILRRHGISLFFRRTFLLRHISLRGTLSLRILSSLQSSFAVLFRSPLLWFLFVVPLCGSSLWPLFRSPPHFAAPLLRPLFCGPSFAVSLLLFPFRGPHFATPFRGPFVALPFCGPPGKAIFGTGRG